MILCYAITTVNSDITYCPAHILLRTKWDLSDDKNEDRAWNHLQTIMCDMKHLY